MSNAALGEPKMIYINNNLRAYASSVQGADSSNTCIYKRYITFQPSELDNTDFLRSKRILLEPNNSSLTLNYELVGIRAADWKVIAMSERKEAREVHSADLKADAIFLWPISVNGTFWDFLSLQTAPTIVWAA